MRIHIIGASGAGKTTLARRLAAPLQLRHIELDGHYWRPGWQRSPLAQFRDAVYTLLDGDAWIMDGTYDSVRDLIWRRVDTVVWLDYAAPVILHRVLRRGMRDILRQTDLWGTGNRESWRLLLGRDSLLLRSLRTLRRMRALYPALCAQSAYQSIDFVHLRSRKETRQWLTTTLDRALSRQATFCAALL